MKRGRFSQERIIIPCNLSAFPKARRGVRLAGGLKSSAFPDNR